MLLPPRTIFSFTRSLCCLFNDFQCILHTCLSVNALIAQGKYCNVCLPSLPELHIRLSVNTCTTVIAFAFGSSLV